MNYWLELLLDYMYLHIMPVFRLWTSGALAEVGSCAWMKTA